MLFYLSPSHDPYYNLALEEYLLTQNKQDIMLLYINQASVVLGRFQIPYKEIDVSYLTDHDIKLARRSSGGGTVYHDLGNLNYSYILQCQEDNINHYDFFNQKTVDILQQLGYKALSFQRNNIFCQNKKVSGVAQYKRGNRIVHHGTLLVQADLEQLRALFTTKDYYVSKSVASVSSSVSNLSDLKKLSMDDVITCYQNSSMGRFTDDINQGEVELLRQKYASIAWTLGKSPKYQIQKTGLTMSVEQGKITQITPAALSSLIGEWHCAKALAGKTPQLEQLF